ncbi:benenodin family lasso peptide [Sphingomonas sp. UYP23]
MERQDDMIDLGAASVETKGPTGPIVDFRFGMPATGLNDE